MADPTLDQVLAAAGEPLARYLGAGRLDIAAEAEVRDILLAVVTRLGQRSQLGFESSQQLVQTAYNELFGLGVLQSVAEPPMTTDVVVMGPHEAHVCRAGVWVPFDPGFASEEALVHYSRSQAERRGYRVDHASPYACFDFDAGAFRGRFHVVIPPATRPCAQLSIRIHHLVAPTLPDQVRVGTLSAEASEFLAAGVAAKLNILISGGGDTGKTTMANALGRAIPEWERVVTIEDTGELQLVEHRTKCTALFTQEPNIEGKGRITARQLIPQALRMSADRIIFGEVRCADEAADLLDVMNTGHEGSLTSIHANSAGEALARLATLLGQAGWGHEVAVRHVAATVALVVHLTKAVGGRRMVESVTDVDGAERAGVVRTTHIFERDARGKLVCTGMPRPDRVARLTAAGWRAPDPVDFEEVRRSW